MQQGTTEKPGKGSKRRLAKDILRIVLVAAFFLGMLYLLKIPEVRDEILNINHIRERFGDKGPAGVGLFVGAAALLNAVGLPRTWVSIVGGTIFGAAIGIVASMVATLAGATANFYAGRWFLKGPLMRRVPPRVARLRQRFQENGFRWTLYMRFFPASNATVTSLLAGASKVHYRHFILATAIGFFPETVVFALFGSSAAKQNLLQFIGGLLLLVAIILLDRYLRARDRASSPTEDVEIPEPATIAEVALATRQPDSNSTQVEKPDILPSDSEKHRPPRQQRSAP